MGWTCRRSYIGGLFFWFCSRMGLLVGARRERGGRWPAGCCWGSAPGAKVEATKRLLYRTCVAGCSGCRLHVCGLMASATANQLLWGVSRGRHVPVLLHSLSALNAPSSPPKHGLLEYGGLNPTRTCLDTFGVPSTAGALAVLLSACPPLFRPPARCRLLRRPLPDPGWCVPRLRSFPSFPGVGVLSLSLLCVWSCSRSLVLLKGDEPGRPEPSSLGAGRRGRVRGPPQPHQVCYESCKRRRNGVTGCGICAVRWTWKRGGDTTAVSTTSYRERRFSRLEIRPSPGQGHACFVASKHVS